MGKQKVRKPFRLQQFTVSHSRSSMPVGVDAMLIGAWAGDGLSGVSRVLDVGCGCGLIALMCAQRFEEASVDAIDIDLSSVEEASINFISSPWNSRLHAVLADVEKWSVTHIGEYDLIVSNPPYFDAGVVPESRREVARHTDTLSPYSLLTSADKMLRAEGVLCMIFPVTMLERVMNSADNGSLQLSVEKICYVQGNPEVTPKRVMLQMRKCKNILSTAQCKENKCESYNIVEKHLVIETERGKYTDEYLQLTRDFHQF